MPGLRGWHIVVVLLVVLLLFGPVRPGRCIRQPRIHANRRAYALAGPRDVRGRYSYRRC